MNTLEKIIQKYEKNVIKLYLEDDFVKKTRIERKIDAIIAEVYEQHVEDEFYNKMFASTNLFVLAHIANSSFCNNFDLYKSLEILESIKSNAYNLFFTDIEEKNIFWQDFFSKMSLVNIRNKIEFYESINDQELFDAYYYCTDLFDKYYEKYLLNDVQTCINFLELIFASISKLQEEKKESKFFDILLTKSIPMQSRLYLIMTCYLMCHYNYRFHEAMNILLQIKEKDVPLPMWRMLRDILNQLT